MGFATHMHDVVRLGVGAGVENVGRHRAPEVVVHEVDPALLLLPDVDVCQAVQAAGIREPVDDGQGVVGILEPVLHAVTSDESAPAGQKYIFSHVSPSFACPSERTFPFWI